MISLHATRPARIARRTSWRRDPVTGGGELETYSPFSVSMGQALWVIMIIAGPPLILMLVVGLVISMVQAATSINEQTLSFVPKLIVVAIALAVCGSSIMILLADFTKDIFAQIPLLVR